MRRRGIIALTLAFLPLGLVIGALWYFRFAIYNSISQFFVSLALAVGLEAVPDTDVTDSDEESAPDVPAEPDGAADLQATLTDFLPASLQQYARPIAAAAVANEPDLESVNAAQFAYLLAAIMLRESLAGALLSPHGPTGTGDPAARWVSKMPAFVAQFPATSDGQTKQSSKGATLYHLVPPAAFGATSAGWGYGLMQLDFASYWQSSGFAANWQDPTWNINTAAALLSKNIDALHDAQAGVAAYNHGISPVRANIAAGLDIDHGTTPGPRLLNGAGAGDYSLDVLTIANGYGAGLPVQES